MTILSKNSNKVLISSLMPSMYCMMALASSEPSPKPLVRASSLSNIAGTSEAAAILAIMLSLAVVIAVEVLFMSIAEISSSVSIDRTLLVVPCCNAVRLIPAAICIALLTILFDCFILAINSPAFTVTMSSVIMD